MKRPNVKTMLMLLPLTLAACAGGSGANEAQNAFKTVDQLSSKECSAAEVGSMLWEKKSGTMYACTDGTWLPLGGNSQAISCETKESADGSSVAIICNGETIGSVKNGANGESCQIVGEPLADNSRGVMTLTIKCGEAETKMEVPFTPVNTNEYRKHVVVRFPVQAIKETKTDDIYEEIWKNFKGGDNAELTVTDLD